MDRALGRGRSDDNMVSFEKRYSSHFVPHPLHLPPHHHTSLQTITLPFSSHLPFVPPPALPSAPPICPSPLRYNTYQTQTMHIIQHYEERNLVRRIDSAPPPDQVCNSHKPMHHSPYPTSVSLSVQELLPSVVCRL